MLTLFAVDLFHDVKGLLYEGKTHVALAEGQGNLPQHCVNLKQLLTERPQTGDGHFLGLQSRLKSQLEIL